MMMIRRRKAFGGCTTTSTTFSIILCCGILLSLFSLSYYNGDITLQYQERIQELVYNKNQNSEKHDYHYHYTNIATDNENNIERSKNPLSSKMIIDNTESEKEEERILSITKTNYLSPSFATDITTTSIIPTLDIDNITVVNQLLTKIKHHEVVKEKEEKEDSETKRNSNNHKTKKILRKKNMQHDESIDIDNHRKKGIKKEAPKKHDTIFKKRKETVDLKKEKKKNRNDEDGCQKGYDGILLISRVIRKAGAGTMFFQSIVDSLLYAKYYNLIPWIWINDDENRPCYDPKVHGIGPNQTFVHKNGSIRNINGKGDMECKTAANTRPGPPHNNTITNTTFTLVGNGLWQSYFQPIMPQQPLCSSLPIYELTRSQIMPDMHRCSELAVRGWAFRGIPNALLPLKDSEGRPMMRQWLQGHRQRASKIITKYFHLQPWLRSKIERTNNATQCLAAHIRLTDKASGRDKKGLDAYLPYILAYANVIAEVSNYNNAKIYIATDDAQALNTLQEHPLLEKRLLYQEDAVRSTYEKVPIFALLQNDKHRSNTEALIDIYSMAKCQYFVHGYSGMAEAVTYVNYPKLHEQSINIDDEQKMTPTQFQNMISKLIEKL